MQFKFYFFIAFFTALFLFYPGDSPYFHIFAYNRKSFMQQDSDVKLASHPIIKLRYPSQPVLTAEGVYIADLETFSPVYEKNATNRFFPASTTKMITALVVMDVYKPDDIITVPRVINDGQLMGLVQGEQITVENLLYGMLVYSGNDAAYAFADAYGFDRFIDLMNKKATSLGMQNTHFKNPAGLDDDDQYTTPQSLALAAREVLKHPILKKIVGTKEITISDVNYTIFHKLTNVNKLLGEIPGIGGLKTGYTEAAGENLVSFYKKNGHEFLIVILKSQDRFADTQTAVKWIDDTVTFDDPLPGLVK
jgi:D-alanyl-D-alanine carboxypeptidase (penicillin-binding protein 5/6)